MTLSRAHLDGRLSVKTRITVFATLILGLSLAIGAISLATVERRSLLREIDAGLDDRLAGILDDVKAGEMAVDVPLTGRESGVVQVIDTNGRVVAATPGLHDVAQLNKVVPGVQARHRTVTLRVGAEIAERWRVAAQRFGPKGDSVDIYAASGLDAMDRTIGRLRNTLLAGVTGLIGIFSLVAHSAAKRSLAPVERLSETVNALSPDKLHLLPELRSNDEVARLVRTTNRLIGRINESRAREQRFAADASHELRTPLTTARLSLEIGRADGSPAALERSIDETLIEIGRLEGIARDLLELTRLDPVRVRARTTLVDACDLIRTEVLARSRGEHGLRYTFRGDEPMFVRVDEALFLRAVRNVVDNAGHHARSLVEVELSTTGTTSVITVGNDGPPILKADRSRIFEPFTRLDGARSRHAGGTGLGLSIAAEILVAHGGSIVIEDRLEGGPKFVFRLPVNDDARDRGRGHRGTAE